MTAARHRLLRTVPQERLVDAAAAISHETIRSARNGDPVAFAQLVRMYYPRCLRFAQHLLSSREDAEECVQDTFVRVHRALHRYEERERFDAWLYSKGRKHVFEILGIKNAARGAALCHRIEQLAGWTRLDDWFDGRIRFSRLYRSLLELLGFG